MMAFFFTMPISRMMPISAMTLNSVWQKQQRQDRADAGRGQRGENGDGMDVAFVENAEHDVDGDQRGEDQQSARWPANSETPAAVPWKLAWMLAGMSRSLLDRC